MGIAKDIDEAAYMSGHNASGIKAGDRVKVTQEASTLKGRWGNASGIEMDPLIGKTFLVTSDGKDFGFRLDHVLVLFLPYFVLEKVDHPLSAERSPQKVTIGRRSTIVHIYCNSPEHAFDVHGQLEKMVASGELFAGVVADEVVEPPRANVGDWVRRISPPSKPVQVVSVGTCGVVAGNASDDDARFVTGIGYTDHGNYEIVRQVVTPWTMKDACEALAKHGFDIETSRIKQTCVTVHERGLHTERRHTISFEALAEPCPIGAFNWRFPDGTPCGNVTWEVV